MSATLRDELRAVSFGGSSAGSRRRATAAALAAVLVAHVFLSIWGYAELDRLGFLSELWTMLAGGIYAGMITATIGAVALVAVVFTSVVIVRRRLRYEWWYAVHLLAYAGMALAWFHQIPTGNELVLDQAAAEYWTSLYVATLALLVGYRLLMPALQAVRHRLRVAEVVVEGPGVVSLRIEGGNLDRLGARPGQFFLWRFLSAGRWWKAHETFSTSKPASEVSRIARGELAVEAASEDVRDVLARCEELREQTGGFFDAYARGTLDPSGLVKGWSVDRGARLLDEAGIRNYAINAGGDIRLSGGARPDETWRVGIQHPRLRHRVAAVVEGTDLAVATSGAYARGEHVLDPHTGRAPVGILSVTITGPDLAIADAYATAAFAMGREAPRWTVLLPRG